ncbi:hypothetical protein SteCoe_29483 [Stentor coeruleus]|uniref:non-specific serine/threonine protein kinase n=1 Tax=Stentor coeruleus TaxID=5963 RepID=A0A1R2B646_9CILI|nr:hypothetical protein SteCoe_29483 [Stentor coeruleus]
MNKNIQIQRQWFISSKTTDINADYVISKEIGSGAFGKVFLAEDRKSLSLRAVKVIQKIRVQDFQTFVNEIEILKKLDHPNIVNIIESYENERICYIVLEHCRGGELFDRLIKLNHFTEIQAALIMKQLLSAMIYIHNNNICHRDLKPENCLYITEDENSELKIIDFGFSVQAKEEDLFHDLTGTLYYIAPEMISGSYTKVVDCWSLGVILYVLLSGTPPFNGKDNNEILMNVYNGSYTFRPKTFKSVSDYAKDLISRLLTKDPNHRITAQEAYMHPWIQGTIQSPYPVLPVNLLASIKNFMDSKNLKKASLMFIASKLTEVDIRNIRKHFKDIDVNGDGVISKTELVGVIKNLTPDISDDNLQILVDSLDINDNGNIDYTEFITGCLLRKNYSNSGYLESAFKHFDKDNSGLITVNEVKEVLNGQEVVQNLLTNDVEQMIAEFDKNKDGCVDYREFIDMMTQRCLL